MIRFFSDLIGFLIKLFVLMGLVKWGLASLKKSRSAGRAKPKKKRSRKKPAR